MPLLKCVWCKKDFKGRKERIFCSLICADYRPEYNRLIGKTKTRVWINNTCQGCKKNFSYLRHGANQVNIFCSKKCSKIGDKNPMWKNTGVSYKGIHQWVRRHLSKPAKCKDCKKVPPLDLANISQKYKRDLTDWEWLCRSCHMIKDGRLKQLQINNKKYWKS